MNIDKQTPEFLGITALRDALEISFYLVSRYRRIGLLDPDAVDQRGRELWLSSRLPEIKARIEEFKNRCHAAKNNFEPATTRDLETAQTL